MFRNYNLKNIFFLCHMRLVFCFQQKQKDILFVSTLGENVRAWTHTGLTQSGVLVRVQQSTFFQTCNLKFIKSHLSLCATSSSFMLLHDTCPVIVWVYIKITYNKTNGSCWYSGKESPQLSYRFPGAAALHLSGVGAVQRVVSSTRRTLSRVLLRLVETALVTERARVLTPRLTGNR